MLGVASLKGVAGFARNGWPRSSEYAGRAKIFHIPGYIWHLTHRCHNKDHLLKFSRDKKRWMHWLFEAKKRYGLTILNYVVTSNHIHLLVYDDGRLGVIPRSILLAASRTAREYNVRKERSGAFWEDHYHATAVDTSEYLRRCLVYIDLNMVRAGVVGHPGEWRFGGYSEIKSGRQRFRLIDSARLLSLLGIPSRQALKDFLDIWILDKMSSSKNGREAVWTESVAVGGEAFVKKIKEKLGPRANSREVARNGGYFVLREGRLAYSYNADFGRKNIIVRDFVKLGKNRLCL